MKNRSAISNSGFTLIEMMVALALFTIVIVIASGSLLSLIGASSNTQSEQSIMSTITFAMDSMTREIRTGSHYFCISTPTNEYTDLQVRDCSAGANGISFVEAGSSITRNAALATTRIAYYVSGNKLYRKVGKDAAQSILSDGIYVNSAKFFVVGTSDLNNDGDAIQPAVTIVIVARDENDVAGKLFTLQSTVTQRELDI